MEFALFYEIPVPRPWSRTAELQTIELMGKHVLPEFSSK